MDNLKTQVANIIEERIMLASKNKVTQKLTLISKILGKPIIYQNSLHSRLEDPYELEEMIYDPIQVYEAEDWSTGERGFYFDGLKFGINFCITCTIHDEKTSELKATYNGYLVYKEEFGELKAYAPFPLWEDAMNMFYEGSTQIERKRKIKQKEENEITNKGKLATFWNKFKMLWGL